MDTLPIRLMLAHSPGNTGNSDSDSRPLFGLHRALLGIRSASSIALGLLFLGVGRFS